MIHTLTGCSHTSSKKTVCLRWKHSSALKGAFKTRAAQHRLKSVALQWFSYHTYLVYKGRTISLIANPCSFSPIIITYTKGFSSSLASVKSAHSLCFQRRSLLTPVDIPGFKQVGQIGTGRDPVLNTWRAEAPAHPFPPKLFLHGG